MNCTACFETIDKSQGYYLVMKAPYCKNCYQQPVGATGMGGKIHSTGPGGSENLLEAFREYQKQSRNMTCQGH